jgi:hypothetical protein
MRVLRIVVLKPAHQLLHHSFGIWTECESGVIALDGFDQNLSHAIALWAGHRRGHRLKAQCTRK